MKVLTEKERKREYDRKRYLKKRESILNQAHEYYKENSDKRKQYNREYYSQNRERILEAQRVQYNPSNKRAYREANWDRIKQYSNKYRAERFERDAGFKINYNISNHIRKALQGGKAGRGWEKLVGYSLDQLMQHLEQRFDENMNWENYGSYWHIDHIIPRSYFDFTSVDDKAFKECWALSNLQPLEATENILKSDKLLYLQP